VSVVAILSSGAMGSALGAGWASAGNRVVTTTAGRSPRTMMLAEQAGMEILPSLGDALSVADIVASVLPPGEALGVAREIAAACARTRMAPLVVEMNAVSPDTVVRIGDVLSDVGVDLVDGSISGPPPRAPGTRAYLSGRRCAEIVALRHPFLDITVVGDTVGRASAVKMCTASVHKGFAALLTHALVTAHANGVVDVVRKDLHDAFPGRIEGAAELLASSAAKAHRYVAEMEQIAATQAAAGLPPDLFKGMAAVWAGIAATPPGGLPPEEAARRADPLSDLLAALMVRT
jgi:3-hydroxyisobutyrate dehydrogenase-like beta-hydroxyacid dehydrogenase